MSNIYAMGQNNYTRTLPKMKNLLSNWHNSAFTIPIYPTISLAFSQERTNYDGTVPTNTDHYMRPRRLEQYIFMVKSYIYNHFVHYSVDWPDCDPI